MNKAREIMEQEIVTLLGTCYGVIMLCQILHLFSYLLPGLWILRGHTRFPPEKDSGIWLLFS